VGCIDIAARGYFPSRWGFYLTTYLELTFCAESMTAVNVSVKDRLTLSISIAVGGAMVSLSWASIDNMLKLLSKQTALLIIPCVINYILYICVLINSIWYGVQLHGHSVVDDGQAFISPDGPFSDSGEYWVRILMAVSSNFFFLSVHRFCTFRVRLSSNSLTKQLTLPSPNNEPHNCRWKIQLVRRVDTYM
jgi:hypothetical protein